MSRTQASTAHRTFSDNFAQNYQDHFVPAIGAPIARDLVRRAELQSGERVLDVACGTGIVARLAAEQVGPTGTVAGLDVNPGMLGVARSATPGEVAIDWHQASAEAMPLPDGAFDVVLCQMGLQFFPDRQAALAEMHRVTAPGGRILVNAPGPTPPPMAAMAGALATHLGPEVAGFVHAVFSLHDPAELGRLLEAAGFAEVVVDSATTTLRLAPPRQFLWQYVHSTPMAAALAHTDDATRQAIEDDFAHRVGDHDALVVEVGMLTATAARATSLSR